ncbi:hypothetical protein ACFQ1S_37540 [Kibdelosporangium lantanae]|uniref:Uncharacterized protein n=1 Tax=Kibdelosporangium lantanae TaxID=1497396 RepID=A0ABW3MJR7_9PSEU
MTGDVVMFSAGVAMMVLALAALVMVLLSDRHGDQDQTSAEEPVVSDHDGLPRILTTV